MRDHHLPGQSFSSSLSSFSYHSLRKRLQGKLRTRLWQTSTNCNSNHTRLTAHLVFKPSLFSEFQVFSPQRSKSPAQVFEVIFQVWSVSLTLKVVYRIRSGYLCVGVLAWKQWTVIPNHCILVTFARQKTRVKFEHLALLGLCETKMNCFAYHAIRVSYLLAGRSWIQLWRKQNTANPRVTLSECYCVENFIRQDRRESLFNFCLLVFVATNNASFQDLF